MNTNTLKINVQEQISITDVFCYIKKFIKKVITNIVEIIKINYVIKILFGGVNNYSNPPNSITRTRLNESFKYFSFAFVLYN